MIFRIIDQYISIQEFEWCREESWSGFATAQNKAELYIQFVKPRAINRDISYACVSSGQKMMICGQAIMLTDAGYKRASIYRANEKNAFQIFSAYLFYTHAVRRQMLQLHCATIDDRDRGILFLGPSGIGKTTQAERWAQYRGSAIINGDIGFVQRTPAGYTAWGTPWHGSSPYCLNASVPVKALVVLKQAPQNALRELTGFEKVREVSGSVFYPTWLEDGMELCTDTLNHLLSDLPVYRLDNRADEEAVRLLAAEIDRIS